MSTQTSKNTRNYFEWKNEGYPLFEQLTCIIHSRHTLSLQSPSDCPGFFWSHTDFPVKAA